MADYLGLTVETVSREMTKLKRSGLISLNGSQKVVLRRMRRLHKVPAADDDDEGAPPSGTTSRGAEQLHREPVTGINSSAKAPKERTNGREDGTLRARAHVGEGSYRLTYNLFRRRGKPDLHCAVPQDRPVPSFLDATFWELAGSFGEGGAAPSGFEHAAALIGTRVIGFHLFQVLRNDVVLDVPLAA